MFENGGGATAYANWHDERSADFVPIHVYHRADTDWEIVQQTQYI